MSLDIHKFWHYSGRMTNVRIIQRVTRCDACGFGLALVPGGLCVDCDNDAHADTDPLVMWADPTPRIQYDWM